MPAENRVLKKHQFHTFQQPGDPVEIWITPCGFFQNLNTALVDRDAGVVVLIDPFDGKMWLRKLAEEKLTPTHILLTHTHFDHTFGLKTIRKAFPGIQLLAHREAIEFPRKSLKTKMIFGKVSEPTHQWTTKAHDEMNWSVGNMNWRISHSPGHAPGLITLRGHGVYISGDLLFTQLSGRCDLPGSDPVAQVRSLENARAVLQKLPPDQPFIPGHVYPWIDQSKTAWVTVAEVLENNQTLKKLK